MQPHDLDHGSDLGLGRAQAQGASVGPQATRERRQVEHQRWVRECELVQIDDHVALCLHRPREGLPTVPLSRSVLIPPAAQNCGDMIEVDDPGNLHGRRAARKGDPPADLDWMNDADS